MVGMLTAIFLRGLGKTNVGAETESGGCIGVRWTLTRKMPANGALGWTTVGVETEAGDKTREVVLGIANKLDWSTNFPVA